MQNCPDPDLKTDIAGYKPVNNSFNLFWYNY